MLVLISPLVGRLDIVAKAVSVRRDIARHLRSQWECLSNFAGLSVLMWWCTLPLARHAGAWLQEHVWTA